MFDTVYVGSRLKSLETTPQLDGYTKVVIEVNDGVEISAGNDLGRTLRLENPWGTQEIADNILQLVRGFQYQPYTASDAQIEPAAEIGDGITLHRVYSGLYKQKTRYGRLMLADVSAPTEHVIDHEYPYIPKQDRKISRSIRHLSSELTVQAGLISAEVRERKTETEELFARLELQADQITAEVNTRKTETEQLFAQLEIQGDSISAKVSKTGGNFSSFGWALDDSSWTIKANSSDVLKATKNGLEVYGKVTATSGKIGGFDILSNYLSYNGQTWGGTNTVGGYFGVNGIQLGKNFKVDMSGNLTAESGTFLGSVNAGNIRYGDDYGTLHASGLTSHSIVGTQIGYGAVSTSYTSAGINTSLGYADYSNGVFQGWNTAQNMNCTTLNVTSQTFAFANKTCYLGSTAVTTALGGTTTIQYIGWR